MNLAILLAAYGSRQPGARAVIERIRDRVLAAHPGAVCAVAYTSHCVRGHLARCGQDADSVAEALDRLRGQGCGRVAVLSLHIVPGEEFEGVLAAAAEARTKGQQVEVAGPLLTGEDDVERVAGLLARLLPQREDGETVLLMGHGSRHPGNALYASLDRALNRRSPHLHLGALEADPGIEHLRDRLLAQGAGPVLLLPFLFGPGHHATQDLAEGPDSWLAVLTRAGLSCRAEIKGAGEYDELVDLWLEHLDAALARLSA
jgi:sirohydrochlorin cobaltochelatase